jgi:hypothetical protein
LRHWSIIVLYCARAASGTLPEMQASYFVRKSSHSGTPILSPPLLAVVVEAGLVEAVAGLLVVVVVVVVVVLLVLVVLAVVVFDVVSDPPQAVNRSANKTPRPRGMKVLFNWVLLRVWIGKRWNNTRKSEDLTVSP